MPANSPDRLNVKRTLILSLSFMSVLLAWSYFNFKVPRILDLLIPEFAGKQTLKGFIMAIDNLVAVVLQPYFGNLSDRTKSKLGRRMPFIVIGTISAAFFFVLLPWLEFLLGFVLIILLFDVAMAFYRSVSIAIIPDYTIDTFRSKASALQQFIANLGGVIGFAVPIITGMFSMLTDDWQRGIGFFLVAIIMGVLLLVQLLLIKETPTGTKFFELNPRPIEINPMTFEVKEKSHADKATAEPKVNIYQEIGLIFKAQEKSFMYMLLVVFCAYFSFASIEAFFSSFAQVYLGKADGVSGTLFLAYSVPMILTAPIWGVVGQKLGRKKATKLGLLGVIIAGAIFAFILVPSMYNPRPLNDLETNLTTANILLMINLACISMPWMCFIVNSFPIVWNLAPEGRVGAFTGIYYTFNQLAYSLSPVFMGLVLDAFGFLGSQQYIVMFPTIVIFMALSLLFMFKVKRGDADLPPETMEAYEKQYKQKD
jgi:Na+/melibiose symporter-like transporter